MKRLRYWLLLLSTLLLTAVGALLPYTVSRIQDVYVENRIESQSFDPVNLTLRGDGDVMETLRVISGDYTGILWTGKTALSVQTAIDAAVDAMQYLSKAGLIVEFPEKEVWSAASAEPMLLFSTENPGTISAVVWFCYLWDDYDIIYIDDESGKMAALEADQIYLSKQESKNMAAIFDATDPALSEEGKNMDFRTEAIHESRKIASKWAAALTEYYGMEVSVKEETAYSDDFLIWSQRKREEYGLAAADKTYINDTSAFLLHIASPSGNDSCDLPILFCDDGCIILFNLR